MVNMSRVAYSAHKVGSMHHRLRFIFATATIFGATFLLVSINDISKMFNINYNPLILVADTVNNASNHSEDSSFTIRTEGCTIPGLQPLDDSIRRYVSYPSVSVEDISSPKNDDRVSYRNCIYFNEAIEVKDEFVNIICKYNKKRVYEQFFIFVIELNSEIAGKKPKSDSSYNVVIMGIDAVSRLNFHRTMPNTLKFLKDNGAVELLGYNKVGDNTFPNLIPMLLGIRDVDINITCAPRPLSTFDNCPFIWEWFRQAGYYTALGEDSGSLGTFNYLKVGFARKPTDYYIHTFINEAEHRVGNNKDFNSNLCMNDKYFYKVLLDYVERLMITLRSRRFFGFFWEVTMSHDYLNYPMKMDQDYEKFFRRIQNENILDDTFLFLVSDHGIRWGDIRHTKQGRLEERLPFVYVLVPQSFKQNYTLAFNNLKLNSHRLTSPFDLHSTLNDLVDLDRLKDITSRSKQLYWKDRSISLFLPIPTNRSCSLAGIEDHWCTCHQARKLSTNSIEAIEASAQLIRHLNLIVDSYKMCAKLKLSETIDIMEMQSNVNDITEGIIANWREFMVVVRSSPGGGIFEATLRQDPSGWSLSGTISRLNLYGDQSRCVSNSHLKLYCFCLRVSSGFYTSNINQKALVAENMCKSYYKPLRLCSTQSSKEELKPPPPSPEKKRGLIQRFKEMYRDYWYVLVPVHMATSAIWFGGFYYAVRSGVDVVSLFESLGVSEKLMEPLKQTGVGYFALAFAMYKAVTPLRYAVTIGGTTVAIKKLTAIGWIKPVPSKERLKEMLQEKKENLHDKFNESKQHYHAQIKEKQTQVIDEMRRYKTEMRNIKDKVKKM
ncbi:unnamed protein product [Leptidea sinapis]|uniref:DUF1279 domain-containing protein n=1 Tax=Leptidea sinapis TaxID=189913 RepID=A0A5E4QNN7_9NEOP|nr:unnamed protein product [Leptidea sinapis]